MATKISSNQQHDQIGRGNTTGGGTVQVSSSAAAAAATILNNLSQNRAMRRSGGDYNHHLSDYGQQGMASSSQGHSNRQHGNMKAYDVQQTEGDEDEDDDDDEELDEDGEEEDDDEEEDDGEEDDNYELDEYQNNYPQSEYSHHRPPHHAQLHHAHHHPGSSGLNNHQYQPSHHQYNNNPITFAPVSNSNSAAKRKRANACLNDPALLGDIIQVNCNSIVAELHKKKFGSGGKGHCIRVIPDIVEGEQKPQERWMTPIEFESYCGKGNCRDWKRTIKAGGQPLVAILNAKILVCHAVSCSCAICNRNDSLVGPIKPFIRYKRRKKDQILAENAFKKFLSLKPPTLFRDNGGILQNKPSSMPSSSLLPPPLLPSLPPPSSSAASLIVAQSSSATSQQQHQLNPSPTNNSHPTTSQLNCFDSNTTATSSSNELISHSSSTYTNGLSNQAINQQQQKETATSDDLYEFIEQFQESEDRKWQNLEQFAENLFVQARTLKNSIISAKQDSERMRRLMVDRLVATLSASSPSPNNSTNTNDSQANLNKRKLFNNNTTYLEETGENYEETFNDANTTNGSDLTAEDAQKRTKLSDVAQ